MDNNVNLVVVKGDKVFTITEGRKLVRDLNQEAIMLSGVDTDFRFLKKEFPQAVLRQYSDSRLSNRYKAMVDKAANASVV